MIDGKPRNLDRILLIHKATVDLFPSLIEVNPRHGPRARFRQSFASLSPARCRLEGVNGGFS